MQISLCRGNDSIARADYHTPAPLHSLAASQPGRHSPYLLFRARRLLGRVKRTRKGKKTLHKKGRKGETETQIGLLVFGREM